MSISLSQLLARLALIYYVCAVVWFSLGLRTFLSVRRKFRHELSKEQRELYRANDRLDFDLANSDFLWLCVGGLTLFPLRFPILIGVAISNVVCLQIFAGKCTLNVTLQDFDHVNSAKGKLPARAMKDQSRQQWFLSTLRCLVTIHCAIEAWMLGVWTIREWRVLNNNFDFDQNDFAQLLIEPLPESERASQHTSKSFVSNHISIVDTLFFITRLYPSFLAKSSLFAHPLVGPCARALNCVFLNRKSQADRKRTIEVIGDRQNEIWKLSVAKFLSPDQPKDQARVSPQLKSFIEFGNGLGGTSWFQPAPLFDLSTPPMLVFPEGTTSGGKHIIPLKRGAFLGLKPVSPVVLIYRCPQFNLSYDIMPLIWTLPLMLSNLRPTTLDVYWLREVLPPSPRDGDNRFRTNAFCQEVRKRMSRVLLAEAHWEMPKEELPEKWLGSMQTKMECIKTLFG